MSHTEPTRTGDRRAMNERLHRLSHDLKNRIGATLEALRGLREPLPGLDADELHRFAERNLFLAMHTLEHALDDLGVERGPGALDLRPTDLAAIAQLAAERSSTRFARKRQTLEQDIAGPLPIRGDQDQLIELVHALLSNASKFTRQGVVTLRVDRGMARGMSVDAGPGMDRVIFVVSDTGIGMTREQQGRLFQVFTQADASTTRRFGGTGLGLAITKRQVEILGGKITVSSVPKQGAEFIVVIPVATIQPGSAPAQSLPAH